MEANVLPSHRLLRRMLQGVVHDKEEQGHVVDGLGAELDALPESYDAMVEFGRRLRNLPMRPDWPYVEPSGLEEILAECDPERPRGAIGEISPGEASARAREAFLGLVCGCILGKPVEVGPTPSEIRNAAEAAGEWPIADYVTEVMLDALGRRHPSWTGTTRGRIRNVVTDDDINYPVLGMLVLEQHGLEFTKDDLLRLWSRALPVASCWGPERTTTVKIGIKALDDMWFATWDDPADEALLASWVEELNPWDELCGALIRVDAYGYACPGNPALAAELAWRDASFTHRRNGIYASMFVAAAIAAAFVATDPLDPFMQALRFVPRRSHLHEVVTQQLDIVGAADDWEAASEEIQARFGTHGSCHIYQELGFLMTSVRFAENVGHGICLQVSQGLDTDSFGARAGSILGALFGPGHLDKRWLAPFEDEIHTTVAVLHEHSLRAVADRMGALTRIGSTGLG
jgi:ADP-ribosylglycohydrolase